MFPPTFACHILRAWHCAFILIGTLNTKLGPEVDSNWFKPKNRIVASGKTSRSYILCICQVMMADELIAVIHITRISCERIRY